MTRCKMRGQNMEVALDYICNGCNPVAGAIHWTVNSAGKRLIAYASHRLVLIVEPEVGRYVACMSETEQNRPGGRCPAIQVHTH